MKKLTHDLDRYFVRLDDTIEVALTEIVPGVPHDVDAAHKYMEKAYNGTGGPRRPITLVKRKRGGYVALDGRSTLAVAIHCGWPSILAEVVEVKVVEYSTGDADYSKILRFFETRWEAEKYVDECVDIYLSTGDCFLQIEDL